MTKMTKMSKLFHPNFLTYLLENKLQSFKEAMSTPEAPLWKDAINNEIDFILKTIYENWWIFHQVVNLLDINGYSRRS